MRPALAIAAAVLSFAASGAEPVAFVADLEGNASIEGNGKVTFLVELAAGTRLQLGTGSRVAVTYASSGSEYTLRGPGEFSVRETEVHAETGAKPTRRNVPALRDATVVAQVSKTATASLRMRNLQPTPARAGLEFPVDTKVATLQPTLRWTQPAGEKADVILFDGNGKEIWKGATDQASVRPAVKLSAAARYRWTVTSSRGSVGEAQFETLGADGLARAGKAQGSAKSFGDRVMHALLLQELGASQEAREAWQALARERSDLPELAALSR
jgi:hypothetical protein